MRQIVLTRHGDPDVMVMREGPDPIPGDGEVRIAVRAAGVNFADVLIRLGLYPDPPPLPAVVGYEVAGVVDAVGPGVAGRRPGDRVVAFTRFGGYADTVVVPEGHSLPVPAGLGDAEAAAIPVNYLTAYVALYRLANLQEGESVLIHGIGGGVGIAALQLARRADAVVIGTASAAKHDALRGLGAGHLIDPRDGNLKAELRRLTGGRGVDVVLDPLGGASFRASYDLLAPLGRLVVYGASAAVAGERRNLWRLGRTLLTMPAFRPLRLINENRGVLGLNLSRLWGETRTLSRAMEFLRGEVEAGRLAPVVARTFPLDRAADAHRFLQSRANVGKVVLTASSS